MIFTVAKNREEFVRATMLCRSLRNPGGVKGGVVICAPSEVINSDYFALLIKKSAGDFTTYETDQQVSVMPPDWPQELCDAAVKIQLLRSWINVDPYIGYLHPNTLCVRPLETFLARRVGGSAVVLSHEPVLMQPKFLHESGDHNSFMTPEEKTKAEDEELECLSARFVFASKSSTSEGFMAKWLDIFRSGYLRGRAFLTRDASALNALAVRSMSVPSWDYIQEGFVRFGHPEPWIRVHPWTHFISFMGKGDGMEQTYSQLEAGKLLW